jgi:MFS superfamily sulfate permease-like transporter
MSNPASSSLRPEPGRIARPGSAADQIGWMRWLPGLQTLRQYQVAWLPQDIVAGLVLTTMLVPVGIAYAVASGVPGIYGLYATIVPLLAYALPSSSPSSCRCRAATRRVPSPWPP